MNEILLILWKLMNVCSTLYQGFGRRLIYERGYNLVDFPPPPPSVLRRIQETIHATF